MKTGSYFMRLPDFFLIIPTNASIQEDCLCVFPAIRVFRFEGTAAVKKGDVDTGKMGTDQWGCATG